MKQILIFSNIISGTAIAMKIAEDHPDIMIDLFGPKFDNRSYQNLNHIGETYNHAEALEWIKVNYKKYDFIYAADHLFQSNKNFHSWKGNIDAPILSPDFDCYNLEYSKLFVKKISNDLGIPTPNYRIITVDNLENYYSMIEKNDRVVFKIDSTVMAFGWQTRIVEKNENFEKILSHYEGWTDSMFVEEFIEGKDLSFHILCNGKDWVFLGAAKDYKRIYENDQGINCGSAGSYSPVEYFSCAMKDKISSYVDKIIKYLNQNNYVYKGIMYLGFRISDDGCVNLLEINTRPGNPEFNVILPLIQSKNLLKNLIAAAEGNSLEEFQFRPGGCVAVNLLNKIYNPIFKEVSTPNIKLKDSMAVFYYDSEAFFNNYYASILETSESIETSFKNIRIMLERSDLGSFRYRNDITKN
jgi:phosphoribosylamine-glycine ligase